MLIHTQKGGRGSTAGLIAIATELIKLGYTVRIRHAMIDGKSVQVVEIVEAA